MQTDSGGNLFNNCLPSEFDHTLVDVSQQKDV